MTIAPTQDAAQIALKEVLGLILPAGTKIIMALDNRVPEPRSNFVKLWPIRFQRLRTNLDSLADVKFTAAIAGTVMTVSVVAFGTIKDAATVFGVGVTANTTVVDQVSGPAGGVGVYTITPTQTVGSRTMASGAKTLEQGAMLTVQLDFHTADNSASDLAQTVSTVFRDESGVALFAGKGITPLYADDPRQTPFTNENQQYEWRWTVDATFQINQVVSLPQQFADAIEVDIVSVDVVYPP